MLSQDPEGTCETLDTVIYQSHLSPFEGFKALRPTFSS